MVGRQMMGRIATRFEEAAPCSAKRHDEHDLGGVSMVAAGDPAQCEAMGDQQIYDTTPHRETLEQSPHALLSNRGLKVYAGFDEVVLLTTFYRLRFIEKPNLAEEEEAYNKGRQEETSPP